MFAVGLVNLPAHSVLVSIAEEAFRMTDRRRQDTHGLGYSFGDCEIVRQYQSSAYEFGTTNERYEYNGKQFRYRVINKGYLEMDERGLVASGRGSFMESLPLIDQNCPYCSARLESLSGRDPYDNETFHTNTDVGGIASETFRERYACPRCNWWGILLGDRRRDEGHAVDVSYHVSGVLKRFSVSDPDSCLDDLVSWIKRHNQAVTEIDPFKFEHLVRDCLRNRYPECEVRLVGGRKDRGVDIYLARSNTNPVLIQVKRRSNIDKNESVNTVRALNGVLLREGIPSGAVITTAKSFSNEALKEAQIKYSEGSPFERYSMDLIAYDEVIEMIRQLNNDVAAFAAHMLVPSLQDWVEYYYNSVGVSSRDSVNSGQESWLRYVKEFSNTGGQVSNGLKHLLEYAENACETPAERSNPNASRQIREVKELLDTYARSVRLAMQYNSRQVSDEHHEIVFHILRRLTECELLWRYVEEDGVLSGDNDDTALQEIIAHIDAISTCIKQIASFRSRRSPGTVPTPPSMSHYMSELSLVSDQVSMVIWEFSRYGELAQQDGFERSESQEKTQIRDCRYLLGVYVRSVRTAVAYYSAHFTREEDNGVSPILGRLNECESLWHRVDKDRMLPSDDVDSLCQMMDHITSICEDIKRMDSTAH
jgi:hypothetical protein